VDTQQRQQVTRDLLEAYRSGPVAPPTAQHPHMSVDDAYEVQRAQASRWQQDGRRIVGFKVGLTSAAMRRALGVDEPDFGHLFDDMSVPDRGWLPSRGLLQPRAEPEIAFVLSKPLAGPGATAADVRAATLAVAPALEIIDSRITDWRITLADTVADNGSSGLFVLGPQRPLSGLDLPSLGCELLLDGTVVDSGEGAAVLGDPAEAVAWLANELGRRGITLSAGQVILSGSCTAAHPIGAGQRIEARFDQLGSTSATVPALPVAVGAR
jgi:2-keto-4-pentenoate hydratase